MKLVILAVAVCLVVFVQYSEAGAIPNGCERASGINKDIYKYCCKNKAHHKVKTNLRTAGSARTNDQIEKGRKELRSEIERVVKVPEGCFPKPSGKYCCT